MVKTQNTRRMRWIALVLLGIGLGAMVLGAAELPFGAAEVPPPPPTLTPEPIVPTRTPDAPAAQPAATATRATATRATTTRPTARPSATPVVTRTPAVGAAQVTLPATARVTLPATARATTAAPPDAASPTPAAVASTATATPSATAATVPHDGAPVGAFRVPPEEQVRLGVSLPGGVMGTHNLTPLRVGWVMDWNAAAHPSLPAGVAYSPLVRVSGGQLKPDAATLTSLAAARPGAVWLFSNEPDVRWQDNVPPDVYAQLYHEAYTAIKAGDPGAVIAAGGIAQPTALRLRYLDMALDAYAAAYGARLPADAWQIHNYMLREERDSWGVDIPPGISDDTGVLYTIDDSGNLDAFKAQIYAFRRWMAARGYGGQPLLVTEFGIPMPEDYGFPSERVIDFLQETWRFFLTAADGGLGDPSDGGRLVQAWCWFSMAYGPYPTGDLVDPETGAWTPLGQAWISMVSN